MNGCLIQVFDSFLGADAFSGSGELREWRQYEFSFDEFVACTLKATSSVHLHL